MHRPDRPEAGYGPRAGMRGYGVLICFGLSHSSCITFFFIKGSLAREVGLQPDSHMEVGIYDH